MDLLEVSYLFLCLVSPEALAPVFLFDLFFADDLKRVDALVLPELADQIDANGGLRHRHTKFAGALLVEPDHLVRILRTYFSVSNGIIVKCVPVPLHE